MRQMPVLRWYGGKWLLAPWIIEHFPEHYHYIEPYGGAASVLLQKPPSQREVYNDMDDRVVNLFRVLRDPDLAENLKSQLELTPYSRTEYENSHISSDDPVESARRFIVKSLMGHSSKVSDNETPHSFKSRPKRRPQETRAWVRYPPNISIFVERLQGVIVENKNAIDLIEVNDTEEALFYVDPPYVPESRNRVQGYKFDMDESQHEELLTVLQEVEGMVVLSGYENRLYSEKLHGWKISKRESQTQTGQIRKEILYVNPAALKRLPQDLTNSMEPIL